MFTDHGSKNLTKPRGNLAKTGDALLGIMRLCENKVREAAQLGLEENALETSAVGLSPCGQYRIN
jgi:hypothetical protein